MRLRKPGKVSMLAKYRISNKPVKVQSKFWIRKFGETDVAKEIIRKNNAIIRRAGKAPSTSVVTKEFIQDSSIESKQLYYDFAVGLLNFLEKNRASKEVMIVFEKQMRDVLS